MVKRTLSFVLVLTVLASCLFILPVSAEETAFTYQAGGRWTEREVMSGEDFLNSSYMPTMETGNELKYDKTTATAYQNDYASTTMAKFDTLRLNEESDGALEINMDVTMKGDVATIFPAGTLNDAAAYASRFYLWIDNGIKNEEKGLGSTYDGLNVKYAPPTGDATTGSATYGFPWSGTPTAYTSGVVVPVKYVIEKRDNKISAINWAKIGDTWVKGGVQLKDLEGAVTGVGIVYGKHGTRGAGSVMEWAYSNASVKEVTPKTVCLSDLSEGSYANNATVDVDFVLPEGMTEATLTVGGATVQDFAGAAAGAYTGTLDLAKVGKTGMLPVVLSGTANGEAFSASTTIYVPAATSGSLNTALLTQPAPIDTYADKVLMDNDTFLSGTRFSTNYPDNNTYTAPSGTTTYGEYTLTDAVTPIAGAMTGPITAENSTAVGTKIDVNYDVTVVGGTPYPNGDQYYGLAMSAYFGNTEVRASSSGWLWLSTRTRKDGTQYLTLNSQKICDHDGETTVSMKTQFEIVSENQVKATLLAKVGDGAWITGPSMTETIKNGDLDMKDVRVRSWMNQQNKPEYKNSMSYRLANCSVVELGEKNAAISDLSANSYLPTDSAKVDFVLPEGYRNAEITIGTTKAAAFESELTAAGGYTTTINMAEVKQIGSIPVVLSGNMADGTAFKAETSIYIQRPGVGSYNEALFTNPVSGGCYGDTVAMTSDQFLAATKFVDSYHPNLTYTRPTTAGGAATLNAKGITRDYSGNEFSGTPAVRAYSAGDKQVIELTMDVKVDDLSGITAKHGTYILQFFPYVNGTKMSFNYPYEGLAFSHDGTKHTYGVGYSSRWNNGYEAGTVLEYKLTCEIEDGTLIATQYARKKGDTEWQTSTAVTKTFTDLTEPTLTGFGIAVNVQETYALDLTKGLTWTLSNAQVVGKAAEDARLYDMSKMLYTQYDAPVVPVDFNLPEGYREAYILIDGEEVAEFTNASHPAGSYRSTLNVANLDFSFIHEVELTGKMGDGTTFSKKSNIFTVAATEGVDEIDASIEDPTEKIENVTGTSDAFVLTEKTASVKKAAYNGWGNYDPTSNPNGPFLSQYIVELTADVDFTNAVPTLSLIAGRSSNGASYSDGLSVPIDVQLPQKAFKLMVRTFTVHPDGAWGDTTYAYVYADGEFIGSTQYTQKEEWSLGDQYEYISLAFDKPAGYQDETIGIRNLTWNKYSAGAAKAELGITPNTVTVTFDKAMDPVSSEFITLVDRDGQPVEADVVVSGKTATITATSDIPIYSSVVIGAGVKEADYDFGAYFSSIQTKTRLGQALTKGYTIKLNNKPTQTSVYGMTAAKDGSDIKVEIELYAVAADESIGKLIVAAYDANGVMTDIKILDVITEAEGEDPLNLTASFGAAYDSYKAFLWSDVAGDMIPVLAAEDAK